MRALRRGLIVLLLVAAPGEARAQEPWRLAPAEAIEIAARTPEVRAEDRPGADLRVFRDTRRRWRVVLGDQLALVYVDDRSGRVLEAWAGIQASWPMARGYPGAFGRAVNDPWVWIGLSVLFVLPFLGGPPRMLHLDLAVMLAFGLSYAAFNAAEIGVSVPTVYPLLAYLLVRMLWIARRPPAPPPPLRTPAAFLAGALMFLIGARIALNLTGNVIDVGQASVVGADRLAHGEPLYGAFPDRIPRGDTYGPVLYAAYVPFELLLPPRAAGHAAAMAFDLGCLALLYRMGGLLPAYLWAAYPFTAMVSASGSNDALVALLVLAAVMTSSGALTALAGWTKLAPLALAPLLVGRRPAAIAAFAATTVLVLAPFDVPNLVDRTLAFQADRESPFSLFDGPLQLAIQIAAVALAVAVAFVPRRNVPALAAAVLIAVQLGADHWFYLYLVWFAPLTWLALLGGAPARSPPPAASPSPG